MTVVREVAQVMYRQIDEAALAGLTEQGDIEHGEELREDGDDVDAHGTDPRWVSRQDRPVSTSSTRLRRSGGGGSVVGVFGEFFEESRGRSHREGAGLDVDSRHDGLHEWNEHLTGIRRYMQQVLGRKVLNQADGSHLDAVAN